MKKVLLASAAASMLATGALAEAHSVKIGLILDFTGPLESVMGAMGTAGELAFKEVSDSGLFLGGKTIEVLRGDSTCTDAGAAVAAAERLVNAEGVLAILGAGCSGTTTAIANNVAIPNGVTMISPSATSPALTSIEDNGLFFRVAPSDARQGEVLANVINDRGITEVAVTYTNNDYGKGFADAFASAYEALGGKITINAAHEDGKGDYSAEVGALAAAGGDALVVLGYADGGGLGIIRTSIDTGAFDTFAVGDGMYADSLLEAVGADIEGSFGTVAASDGEGAEKFNALAAAAGAEATVYTRESYDAAALIAFAMQKAGEATREAVAANVFDVANAPGEPIYPGELAKGLEILANGGDIDYVGGSNVELIEPGEAAGAFLEYEVKGSAWETVKFR